MEKVEIVTSSDVGGVLIGTKDFGIIISNGYGDSETEIIIFNEKDEKEILSPNAKFDTMVKGKFNIYDHDCSNRDDEDIIITLEGEFAIYNDCGTVCFEKYCY